MRDQLTTKTLDKIDALAMEAAKALESLGYCLEHNDCVKQSEAVAESAQNITDVIWDLLRDGYRANDA